MPSLAIHIRRLYIYINKELPIFCFGVNKVLDGCLCHCNFVAFLYNTDYTPNIALILGVLFRKAI